MNEEVDKDLVQAREKILELEEELDKSKQELIDLKESFQEQIQILITRLPRFRNLIVGIFKEVLKEDEHRI